MADKNIAELPELAAVTDDTLIPVWQPGATDEAQSMTGRQFREFAEASVKPYSNGADAAAKSAAISAETASNAKTAAQNALTGVKNALKSLPAGDTLVINDLTTGGASAALSAEQGKALGSRTAIHQYVGLAGIGLTDAEMSPEDFAANVAAILNALPNKAVVYLSENTANFTASLRKRLNDDLQLGIESAVPRLRLVRFGGSNAVARLEAVVDSTVFKQIFTAHVDQTTTGTYLSPFIVAYDGAGFLLNRGGTLTGDLTLEKETPRLTLKGDSDVRVVNLTGMGVLQARDTTEATVVRQLRLYPAMKEAAMKNAAAFYSNESGTATIYPLLGVHNKPTGTYAGTGSAEAQEKDAGALGNLLLIWNNTLDVVSLVTPRGAICKKGSTVSALSYDECRYTNGVLYLATASEFVNQSGKSYSYRAV